jgi:CxxC motif-containing protein (DUF1111 family)
VKGPTDERVLTLRNLAAYFARVADEPLLTIARCDEPRRCLRESRSSVVGAMREDHTIHRDTAASEIAIHNTRPRVVEQPQNFDTRSSAEYTSPQKSYVALIRRFLFDWPPRRMECDGWMYRESSSAALARAAQLSILFEEDCTMQRYLMSVATSSLALAYAGCVASEADEPADVEVAETQQSVTTIGDPLPGTDPVAFAAAKDNFAAVEDITDGLGPVFNEKACGNCHTTPVVGGSGAQIERRFGEVTNGIFYGYDGAQDNQGGTLRQLFSNGTYTNGNVTCTIPVEREPPSANVHNVGRRTLPLFGLGLVDAMPDGFFDLLAAIEPPAQRGVVLRRIPDFPDVRDPNQSFSRTRVQRFGIKDQQTNLVSFAGDAYINEMGISTQSCFRGQSVLAFANDNQSNNVAAKAGCNGGDLAPAQPAGDPNVPQFTDDAVGSCAGGLSEVQDDLANFLLFMERMAPPPQDLSDPISFTFGSIAFAAVGCANCHTAIGFVTPAHPFNGVPGNMTFFPFSDFLVHDMGSLGDGIGNTGDTVAVTRRMRTAPLWGARFNTQFLHDGRAKTVREAILAHDGQGLASRNAFAALDPLSQALLLRFVNEI